MPQPITTRAHPWIKLLATLRQSARARRDARLALAEGPHLAAEALDAGLRPNALVFTADARRLPEVAALLTRAENEGVETRELSPECYAKISDLQAPEGIAVVLSLGNDGTWVRAGEMAESSGAGWLVAVGVQNPGNAGALARVAEAAGACGLCLVGGVDPTGPKFLRAAMGSAFRLPCPSFPDDAAAWSWFSGKGIRLLLASAHGDDPIPYDHADYSPPVALCVGSEGQGLSADWLRCGRSVYLPMAGRVESLNVAVAAGIWLYEARRAWTKPE